jgi:naphthalene 1,2-dioxygenase system ferredoxin subunit
VERKNWFDTLGVNELRQNDVVGVEIAGRDIAIYAVEGKVYATENLCTHGQARLCDGFLEGHAIECPLHQGSFDIRDGKPLCEPATEPLQTYEVKIEGSRVYVRLD